MSKDNTSEILSKETRLKSLLPQNVLKIAFVVDDIDKYLALFASRYLKELKGVVNAVVFLKRKDH